MNRKKIITAGTVLTVLLIAGCSVFEAVLQPDLPDNIDTDRPLLVQAHLLTTDQIKRCFTAADPLAKMSQ